MATLILFGRLQDVAGWRTREIAPGPVSGLISGLAEENPALGEAISAAAVAFVLNGTLRRDDAMIAEGDEAAFLPPMSGG